MSKELDPTAMNADQAEAALGLTPKPASPTAVLDQQRPVQPLIARPGVPLVAQADAADTGTQEPVQPVLPVPAEQQQAPNFGGIEPMPAMPIPMQQPAAPTPLDYKTPPLQSLPVLPTYESVQNKAVPATPIPTSTEDDHWLDHLLTPVGQFGRGLISGGIETASQLRKGAELITGNSHAPKDDWQNQDEASLSKEELASPAHNIGKGVGAVAGYMAAAAPIAAAIPFELPAGAGLALTGGIAAVEGAAFSGVAGSQERGRKGEPTSAGDVAGDLALGAATGGAINIAGHGLAASLRKIFKGKDAANIAEAVDNQHFEDEQAQTKAAKDALGPEPAESALQRKQQQEMARLAALPPKATDKEPKGETRKLRGHIGHDRILDATPIDEVLAKLPQQLAGQLSNAVDKIGETKALIGHLENQVVAYSENVIKHAKTSQELKRVIRDTKPKLRSYVEAEIAKKKAELHLAQLQHQTRLRDEIADLEDQLQNPKRSHLRAHLTAVLNQAKLNIEKLGLDRDLLTVSKLSHVHPITDRAPFTGGIEKLADNFADAERQLTKAQKQLHNADKVFAAQKKKHQPTFEAVDMHLGEPTVVRKPISHFLHPDQTSEMAVGMQHNSSVSNLIGDYLDQLAEFEKAITAVEGSWGQETLYKHAVKAMHTTPGEAEKALRAAGLIHPNAGRLLSIAALGYQAFNAPNAEAADGLGATQDGNKYASSLMLAGGIGVALAATLTARKFGPHGAKIIGRSMQRLASVLYKDTRDELVRADAALGIIDPAESLVNFMDKWRGAHIAKVAIPDDHGLINKMLQGTATAQEMALATPAGRAFVDAIHDFEDAQRPFIDAYHKQWNEHYFQLSAEDQSALKPVHDCVQFANLMHGTGGKTPTTDLDASVAWTVKRTAAYCFTRNPKLLLSMYLHDVPGIGALQVGPIAAVRGQLDWTLDPEIRTLVGRLQLHDGPLTAIAQSQKPLMIDAAHSQMALLGSLHRQFVKNEQQLRTTGCKSARDYIMKTLTGRLLDDIQQQTFQQAGIDIMQMTGNDAIGSNRSQVGRSAQFGMLANYTRYGMVEQRLWKENAQAVANHINNGDYGAALQRAGWMSWTLAVKQQFGGKAVIPVGAMAILMNNPYTAEATAHISEVLNNYSAGINTFGDPGGMAKWDPVLGPVTGVVAPGVQEKLAAISDLMGGFQKVQKMCVVLAQPSGVGKLLTGSKQDQDVADGQRALKGIIAGIGGIWPEIAGVPVRAVGAFTIHLPDLMHDEHIVNVRSTLPVGEQHNVESNKIMYNYGNNAKFLSRVAALREMLGLGVSKEASNRESWKWAEKAMKGPTAKTEAGVARSGLSE